MLFVCRGQTPESLTTALASAGRGGLRLACEDFAVAVVDVNPFFVRVQECPARLSTDMDQSQDLINLRRSQLTFGLNARTCARGNAHIALQNADELRSCQFR